MRESLTNAFRHSNATLIPRRGEGVVHMILEVTHEGSPKLTSTAASSFTCAPSHPSAQE
jgi:hypothetical protein